MCFKKRKISLKTFAASILIALGANKVSASLKIDERLTEDEKTTFEWFKELTTRDFKSCAMNLNLPNATEAWEWSKIQVDGSCPV